MSLSINLAPIALDSVASAETRPPKVIEFTTHIGHLDTFLAGSRLLDELKLLNRQKIDADTRIQTLELYRKITLEIGHDLEEVYGNAAVPIPEEAKNHATLAEAIWLETGYGYKRALLDLKQKLINFQEDKQHSLVIFRIIEALKNEALVNYLCYTVPSDTLWSDLHKVYFHALQLGIEDAEVNEHIWSPNNKTIHLVYIQTLLMNLANPQRLSKANIRKMSHYVGSLAKFAELRGMGLIEKPMGVFLIELDSNKPPVPYLKNRNAPSVETDILLVTVEVARHIHQQLKFIQKSKTQSNEPLPATALEVVDEELLKHLIKYFGVTTTRTFARQEKKQAAELAIGLEAASILFRSNKRAKEEIRSYWEIMNTSPDGYALKTTHLTDLKVEVGELVSIKESEYSPWVLGYVVWLITKVQHIEAGIKLIAPSAKSVSIKSPSNTITYNALLLPSMKALNQPISILTECGYLQEDSAVEMKEGIKKSKLKIKQLVERSACFDRFEYSLITDDLS
ncbi:MAG: hypothetical protein B7Y48_07020 [Methylophilales bacterium 28-44-11]|nr:MAG: hypothetical protein B7Y48_07020 [Methylophilales bacterium 28-44-11]